MSEHIPDHVGYKLFCKDILLIYLDYCRKKYKMKIELNTYVRKWSACTMISRNNQSTG